ncbi:MAG: family hydrolase [Phenylobacterium sp.]|nr:family hydrolase [Phenylobacterium sp.]
MGIEAVIFDFGGVITASPFEAFNRFEAEHGLPRDIIRRVNATNPHDNAWAHLERSDIDSAEFDRRFREESKALGHEVSGAAVMAQLSGAIRPRMVSALKTCKQHFKVGCITNNFMTEKGDAHRLASAMGEVLELFDAVIESAKAGLRKPDPRIYLMMCELLDVAPGACVYLDDLGINCKPAAALGMTAIKVVDVDQTLADLARATGLAFEAEAAA